MFNSFEETVEKVVDLSMFEIEDLTNWAKKNDKKGKAAKIELERRKKEGGDFVTPQVYVDLQRKFRGTESNALQFVSDQDFLSIALSTLNTRGENTVIGLFFKDDLPDWQPGISYTARLNFSIWDADKRPVKPSAPPNEREKARPVAVVPMILYNGDGEEIAKGVNLASLCLGKNRLLNAKQASPLIESLYSQLKAADESTEFLVRAIPFNGGESIAFLAFDVS